MFYRTRGRTSWNCLEKARASAKTLQWPPRELFSLHTRYNIKISIQGQKFSAIFEQAYRHSPVFWLCMCRNVPWRSLPWCLCPISPNKGGCDALFGDTWLWEQALECPCLLAHNKAPSHKTISELSLGWNRWACRLVLSRNRTRLSLFI